MQLHSRSNAEYRFSTRLRNQELGDLHFNVHRVPRYPYSHFVNYKGENLYKASGAFIFYRSGRPTIGAQISGLGLPSSLRRKRGASYRSKSETAPSPPLSVDRHLLADPGKPTEPVSSSEAGGHQTDYSYGCLQGGNATRTKLRIGERAAPRRHDARPFPRSQRTSRALAHCAHSAALRALQPETARPSHPRFQSRICQEFYLSGIHERKQSPI